ncbi:hypothetical protein DFA_06946 [Cavenderia fasciculata]|uniref:Uncharacterized protein n=1 Tax=Cavenderia fasciculata TaxID=261658 RepID=F4PX41_CACFS|nr:uncharacterized protein DFA_06946 [Cavenderia fasciculata]EGG19844.1 hypothetical protein DFA_06946 [Cavenderia fasciculata]|eukprot:XP_004358190.1 hypothetical protein DFA_06946 [Cavenderia fasciculata]
MNKPIIKDKSEQFFKFRDVHRQEKKLFDKNQFLSFKLERSLRLSNNTVDNNNRGGGGGLIDQLSFPNVFVNKKLISPPTTPPPSHHHQQQQQQPPATELLINKPYCGHCGIKFGIFTNMVVCGLCKINFCNKCVTKLSSNDITGVLREGQVINYCEACVIVAMAEESNRRYYEHVKQSKESNPLYLIYNEQTLLRKAIVASIPNFEYLASSIVDFTRSSPKNRETFLQVYNEVLNIQNELSVLFKEFDKQLKLLISLNSNQLGSKQESVRSNMKHVYVFFLQQHLPKFKTIQNQILHLEMNVATNIYTILCGITLDNKLHKEFWNQFQNQFQDTISVCRRDLFNATVKCGENWETHKGLVDDTICGNEKSFLLLSNHPSKEFLGSLVRKNLDVIKHTIDQINLRVKPDDLVSSKQSLQQLYNHLEIVYKKSLQF